MTQKKEFLDAFKRGQDCALICKYDFLEDALLHEGIIYDSSHERYGYRLGFYSKTGIYPVQVDGGLIYKYKYSSKHGKKFS